MNKFNHVQNFWDKKGRENDGDKKSRENGGDTGQEKYPSHWSLVEWIHVYEGVSPFSAVNLYFSRNFTSVAVSHILTPHSAQLL